MEHEPVDRNEILEIYSIILGDGRHHAMLYTQIWVGGLIGLGALLTALSFIFDIISDLALKRLLLLSVLILGYLMVLAFYWSICQHAKKGLYCRNVARSIEDILTGRTPEEATKLDNLLMTGKDKELRGLRDKDVWAPLVDPPGRLFFSTHSSGALDSTGRCFLVGKGAILQIVKYFSRNP